jgi:rhamnogalacturonyl hydrolase YesR
LLQQYDPEFGWDERLRDTLDKMLPLVPDNPPHSDGLCVLTVFTRMTQHSGDARYLEAATKLMQRVIQDFPRIEGVPALMPERDQVIWNETCCHFAPAAVAIGVANGDNELIALGLHSVEKIRSLNFDAHSRLWRHWGASTPGGGTRRAPALWARGVAWALTALHGVLKHLPVSHPQYQRIVGYLDESIDGVIRTQTAEGLWHNVMDNPDSRICVRASAMLCYLLCESWLAGWTQDARVETLAESAWRGIRGRIWRDKICTACCGTGAGATYQHYMARPHTFYGASAALHAGVAYELAFGKPAGE